MKHWRHTGLLGLILALAASSAIIAAPAGTKRDLTAAQWSQEVWRLAQKRDRESLDRYLQELPQAESATDQSLARFRQQLDLHRENLGKAKLAREEARAKAVGELHEHVAANDLSKALRSAVTIQTLADKLESAFDDPDVAKIVTWAQERIPQVEAENDWLLAQELLYYLRTLYEDTDRFDEYKKYDDQLNAVNRRVTLLAQYAPQRLHELRALRAQRLAEKDLGEYKPRSGSDWQDRIKGINAVMLKAALRTAAAEHIETNGWRPLLRGGLEELRLLATTSSLDESFEELREPQVVAEWVQHIEKEQAMLRKAPQGELDHWTLSRMLDDLLRVNQRTVQIPEGVLYREFGDGAMYELDQFSEIVWPDKLSRFKQATEGAFVGVGILIRHNETQDIVVVNPLEGSPAYFGGLKPDDIIAEVDGETTVGWSLNDAVDRITGAPATKVTLGIQRTGNEGIIPITLNREVIKLRSVMGWWKHKLLPDGSPEWDWYVDPVSRIAYIKLTQFTDETLGDLQKAWKEINLQGKPSGLILDLRFNPGGLLTSAVQVSNLFVKQGVIVSGEDKDGHKAWADQRARPDRAWDLDGVSTVVLINQGSASASEIVAGCLQAHGAAVIVGERSFGKGSVQTVHQTASNARLKLTTQYYRLPQSDEERAAGIAGRLVHKLPGARDWGVDPDVEIKMTPQQTADALELRQNLDVIPQNDKGEIDPDPALRPDVARLLTEGMDPQLGTALLLLQARALGSHGGQVRQAALNGK